MKLKFDGSMDEFNQLCRPEKVVPIDQKSLDDLKAGIATNTATIQDNAQKVAAAVAAQEK